MTQSQIDRKKTELKEKMFRKKNILNREKKLLLKNLFTIFLSGRTIILKLLHGSGEKVGGVCLVR